MTRSTPPPQPDRSDVGRNASGLPTSRAAAPRSSSSAARVARAVWMAAAPLIMLLLALLFLFSSGDLTGREAGYPRVLAVIVAVLSIVAIVRDIAGARVDAEGEATAVHPGDDEMQHRDAADDPEGRRGAGLAVPRVLGFLAVSVVAVFLMSYLGFFAPALLLLGGGLFVLGIRSPWKVAAYTALLITASYLLFVKALQVPFPPAPWS